MHPSSEEGLGAGLSTVLPSTLARFAHLASVARTMRVALLVEKITFASELLLVVIHGTPVPS